MSHYTVTIVLPDKPKNSAHVDEMITELVAPFDENMEVEPYKSRFDPPDLAAEHIGWPWSWIQREDPTVDLTDLPAVAAWLATNSEEKYLLDDEGLYQWSTYNPESKWDWWVVGGRWTGFYELLPGREGVLGRPGVFGNAAEPGRVDVARKGDIYVNDLNDVQTYGVIAEGVWRSPGKMGWWGMSTDDDPERDDFAKWFRMFWTGLGDDAYVAVVDMHI